MDSKERDERAKEGFPERGEVLYDAEEKDERNIFKEKRREKRKDKDGNSHDLKIEDVEG